MKLRKGFTMVELLVVLIILGILVAVATPMYFSQTDRAKASESVAALGIIRQALRDYRISHASYFDITRGNIVNPLPTSVSGGTPTPSSAGVNVTIDATQYFSRGAYTVDATTPTSTRFTNPNPVEFIISADGAVGADNTAGNVTCSGASTDCAIKGGEVTNFRLEMDNSGRIFVSYNGGTNWQAY